ALVRGIVEATGDFNDQRQFGNVRIRKIVVITGGEDDCTEMFPTPQSAASEIQERLKLTSVKADLFVIGIGVPAGRRSRLAAIAQAASGAARFADTEAELGDLLAHALGGAPLPLAAASSPAVA